MCKKNLISYTQPRLTFYFTDMMIMSTHHTFEFKYNTIKYKL